MIELDRLTKHFGVIRAVNEVSFRIGRGEVLGFLGPNGAGKSTTMKVLAGFLTPTSGTARVCGFDVERQPIAAKRRLGYLPEGAPAYPDMTPAGFLEFIAGIRGFSGAERRRRIAAAVEHTALGGVLHQPIDTLSKGFKRRVGLAQALLHDPDVLILDEPTDGLDPNQKHEVRTLIQRMAPNKAIIVSTHILEEVEAVCTRAIIIARGRVVADGTPVELVARDPDHNAVVLIIDQAQVEAARSRLASLPGVTAVTDSADGAPGRIRLVVRAGAAAPQVMAWARSEPWGVTDVRVERGRLDQVFRTITMAA